MLVPTVLVMVKPDITVTFQAIIQSHCHWVSPAILSVNEDLPDGVPVPWRRPTIAVGHKGKLHLIRQEHTNRPVIKNELTLRKICINNNLSG
jgi:hypothetical protein